MRAYNFVRSEQNFTYFFVQRRKDFSRQRRLDFVAILSLSIAIYLRSNIKVVVKSTKFFTFFAFPNFKETVTPKC